ncbi:MAG: DUF1674 domain-containing protein [Hoeflea sp.]|uniref:DUF1674 domain-containing protein n=1 Tax=Hoeflea sp. TaxID=1940281 RepID=UPI003EF6CD50
MIKDAAPEIESAGSSGAGDAKENGPVAAETPDDMQAAKPPLSPAAQRALAEANARRQAREASTETTEKELGGRGGADPARFGDWEINGRAIDF